MIAEINSKKKGYRPCPYCVNPVTGEYPYAWFKNLTAHKKRCHPKIYALTEREE